MIFVWSWNENVWTKQKQQTKGNRAIWLVYRTNTNARGFWLVKRTLGWKNSMPEDMPENFLEINRYFALTSYCNTIGQSNNSFSILWFSLAEKQRVHVWSFYPLADITITNTYRNYFSRSYKNRSKRIAFYIFQVCPVFYTPAIPSILNFFCRRIVYCFLRYSMSSDCFCTSFKVFTSSLWFLSQNCCSSVISFKRASICFCKVWICSSSGPISSPW